MYIKFICNKKNKKHPNIATHDKKKWHENSFTSFHANERAMIWFSWLTRMTLQQTREVTTYHSMSGINSNMTTLLIDEYCSTEVSNFAWTTYISVVGKMISAYIMTTAANNNN